MQIDHQRTTIRCCDFIGHGTDDGLVLRLSNTNMTRNKSPRFPEEPPPLPVVAPDPIAAGDPVTAPDAVMIDAAAARVGEPFPKLPVSTVSAAAGPVAMSVIVADAIAPSPHSALPAPNPPPADPSPGVSSRARDSSKISRMRDPPKGNKSILAPRADSDHLE